MKRQKWDKAKERDERGLPAWRGVEEVRWVKHGNMALRQVRLPCGKRNCGKCPHGPYWYLVVWRGKRATQWYIGKRVFPHRLRRYPDKELLVVAVVNGAGVELEGDQYDYVPEGVKV